MEHRDLRVSDTDREQTAEHLRCAVGEGYITLTEFEERSQAVYAAKTRGELADVLADIPDEQLPASQQSPHRAPARQDERTVEIRGTGTELKRKGAWQVPSELRVRTRFCDTVLDLTEATTTSRVVRIEFDDTASSTKLILPESATVDANELVLSWGDLNTRVSGGPPRGHPHVVLHGRVRAGDVSVRHARGGSWWQRLFD